MSAADAGSHRFDAVAPVRRVTQFVQQHVHSHGSDVGHRRAPSWKQHFPPLQWLPEYAANWKENLRCDILSAITITCLAVPQSMAYALLAGLSPINGYALGASSSGDCLVCSPAPPRSV